MYAFASTAEGSIRGDSGFSVRLIAATGDHDGGGRLDGMCTLNRVLDGDPFYMKITN